VLVEAQLAWYGLPYEIENLDDLFKSTEARERPRPVNRLARVPTLVLLRGAPNRHAEVEQYDARSIWPETKLM
jgi:hypothetical protein